MARTVTAVAPGRVNLIGDHTDYSAGLALPMTIDLGVTARFTPSGGEELDVRADGFGVARVPLARRPAIAAQGEGVGVDGVPEWARLIGAVAELARPETGGSLLVESTLPAGVGLSSSAALCVALARVFGVESPPLGVARLCRAAEHQVGAPVGLMDPWVSAAGRADSALLLDFGTEVARIVPLPADTRIAVVDSGQVRAVRSSAYGERVAECEAASDRIGPLGAASKADLAALRDPILRRRARHVITECGRVRAAADALAGGDLEAFGRLMDESHRSLSADFEVSTPEIDGLVEALRGRPGVLGARLTGAGFGGCVVVLSRAGAPPLDVGRRRCWRVRPVDGPYATDGRFGD